MSGAVAETRFKGIPDIIYGTAFKFEKSQELVEAAIRAGFRGIDTAGSASAYREKLVGDGIRAVLADGTVHREELWIQTKYSPFKKGKNRDIYPYDIDADIPTRVKQSIESSLENLGTTYIDSLVLHSLCPTLEETLSTWKAMEAYVPGKVGMLGISNTDLVTLQAVYNAAHIKPSVVQNRFTEDMASRPNPRMPADLPYAEDPYDRVVRSFCSSRGIAYTPWGLLWGNPKLLEDMDVFTKLAAAFEVTKEVACFAVMRSLTGPKISILCGTRTLERMPETLEGLNRIQKHLEESDEKRNHWKDQVVIIQQEVDGSGATDAAGHDDQV